MDTTDTTGIAVTTGALGVICGVVSTWIKARFSKTKVEPDPLHVEQSQEQALWKENAKDHSNIFDRLRLVESNVASHQASLTSLKDMQDKMYCMITALYEKICNGRKQK